jgi:hypothetical protein
MTDSLDQLMQEYARITEEADADWSIADAREQIAILRDKADVLAERMKINMEPYRKQLDALEAHIRAEILELCETVSLHGVTASYRKGYTSETYPVEETRKILLANPAILPAFRAISKVKTVDPSVRISYISPKGSTL